MKPIKIIQFIIIIIANIFAISVVLTNLSIGKSAQNNSVPIILDESHKITNFDSLRLNDEPREIISSPIIESKNNFTNNDPAPEPIDIINDIVITGQLSKGDTFDSSLRRQNISPEMRSLIIKSLSSTLDFRNLKPSDTYTLQLEKDGSLRKFTYESSPIDVISMTSTYGGYTVRKDPVELESHRVRMTGEINTSLFASFAASGEDKRLVFAFADIFSSKIDFNTETRDGDRYVIIFDKYFKNGKLVGYGKILAAIYQRSNGTSFDAYYYSSDKTIGSYFDFNGQAVGTSFIRSPVPVGRVTSKFSYQRKHPITGVVKPHLGIDLAAPVGTPIMAAADGKIISIGRNKGNGKQIIISHNAGLKSYYGHLSSFKKGLKKGSLVNKKDIIGYVGSSGLATGPHLDYRISDQGVFKNPFSFKFKPKVILSGSELANFNNNKLDFGKIVHNSNLSDKQEIMKISNLTINSSNNIMLL